MKKAIKVIFSSLSMQIYRIGPLGIRVTCSNGDIIIIWLHITTWQGFYVGLYDWNLNHNE
jgi:hypothetical protein